MNSAAQLQGAELQFGNLSGSTFSPDSNAKIVGSTDGTVSVTANSATFNKAVTIGTTLNVGSSITVPTVNGNATSANKWATSRTLTLSGDVSGNVSFNGASNFTLSVGVNKVKGISFENTNHPSGSSKLACNGYFYATRVYNAVWNDIADFIEVEKDTPIEYGKVYIRENSNHRLSHSYGQSGIVGISSDTFGFGVGQKEEDKPQVPIAIGGFVLAHIDDIYESGTALTCTKDGCLTKARWLTKLFFPERIIATFYKIETEKIWHEEVEVKGRHWVKIK